MKRTYITPSVIVEHIVTECNILEFSNQKTESVYEDIPNGLIDKNSNYQEGNGDDAGVKKRGFFTDEEW